jgi:hypothetical protein
MGVSPLIAPTLATVNLLWYAGMGRRYVCATGPGSTVDRAYDWLARQAARWVIASATKPTRRGRQPNALRARSLETR